MNEDVSKMTTQKIQSMMYQIDNNHFQNFADMIKYLESADAMLSDKIQRIDLKMQSVNDEFVRASSVYEMNNKKRQKQQQLLKLQRDRISKDLDVHKSKLGQFKLSPITLNLKQKKYELQKLNQTKQIIEEFNKLVKGKEDEIKKILPLDEKSFNNSAMKIYVFKALLQDIHGMEYENAKLQINKKYTELKNKIIQNFKEGYWNKDTKLIRNTLPYCQEYELMDQVSQFYNEQIFKSVHKVTKMSFESQENVLANLRGIFEIALQLKQGQSEIKNMFFLIQQGFYAAFSQKDTITGENNLNQINMIMGNYSEAVGRKLVTHVFQKIIKQSLQSILKSTSTLASGASLYLSYLQIFYDECKMLIKSAEKIIKQQRTVHLMSTYFQSIFDTYLDTYLTKELNNLDETYQKCSQQITRQISENSANGATQFSRQKQKNNMFAEDKKKTIKNIFQYAIESKKNLFQSGNTKVQSTQQNVNMINQILKSKIQALQEIFVSPSLKMIFLTTKNALARNKKIAKINEVDRNRNEILQIFLSNVEEIIQNLISLISQVVPPFDEKSPPLQPNFFSLVPLLNNQLHEVQLMYEQYKKQNCYRLADTIKLDQNKENLMNNCGKSFNKLLAEAMATILATSSYILNQDFNQYNVVNPDKSQPSKSCPQIISFLQRYIRVLTSGPKPISNFRLNILRTIGLQFVNHLTKYYSQIPYTKQGLSRIFMDIAKYKTLVSQFQSQDVQNKFKLLRSLIDIYVIKNDERSIWQYVKGQQNLNKQESTKIIQAFVVNKTKCEKITK